jgi:hypothetical protein
MVIGCQGEGVELELSASLFGPLADILGGSCTPGEIVQQCGRAAQSADESLLDGFVSAEKTRGVEDVLIGLIRQGLLTTDRALGVGPQ